MSRRSKRARRLEARHTHAQVQTAEQSSWEAEKVIENLKRLHRIHVRYGWAAILICAGVVIIVILGHQEFGKIMVAIGVEQVLTRLKDLAIIFAED